AEIALERAQREEIKGAAQAIIDAQQTEIDEMTGWLQEWHGTAPSGEDHDMGMPEEMENLRTVPVEQFDVAFLEAMIPHHQAAIQMATLVSERTDRAELNTLAEAIMETQQAEIEQFESWKEEWSAE
nr:DUF305 domain-containing protein [Ardenticatenales bacterium]